MTAKRFEVYKVIGSFHEWSIEDNLNDKVVFGCIMHKYEADRLCELLNELHEENEQLRHDATILIQSNQDYRKENEELKKQLTDCEKFRHTVFQQINQEMMKQ